MDEAVVQASGAFRYADGNLGVTPPNGVQQLSNGHTYHVSGWTIAASSAGTRFTDDETGHGMLATPDPNRGGEGEVQTDIDPF